MGAFTYPLFANWAWGGGWLATLGSELRPGPRLRRLRRLRRRALGRRHHRAGDGASSSGRASASTRATASRTRSRARHRDRAARLLHPGVRLVRVQSRVRRSARPATATCASARSPSTRCWPAWPASFGAMFYMWIRYGKPDASMTGNGLLAGLVAITAPSGFVNPMASVIIGLIAGVLVCLSVRIRRARAEGGRSGRRHLGPRHQRHLGRHLGRACSPTARATTAAPGTA